MNKYLLIIGLFCTILFTACTKQVTSPTQGQLIAAQLQKIMKVGEPIYVYNVDGTPTQGSVYNISSDGYITVAYPAIHETYSLSLLKAYFSNVLSNGNNWFLYF